MDHDQKALHLHAELRGKLNVQAKAPIAGPSDLALLYTPGVAAPCREIAADKAQVYRYTGKGNLVAVVTDGSAVLGLGNIGPEAGLPVMEGKALLFKEFGGVDAVPICLDTQDSAEIIQAVRWLAPGFGGINLEDIAAPRCFEIEAALRDLVDIPVFHDDQHGTAIVVLSGLINALKLTGRPVASTRVVINGAGSAGTAICRILQAHGFADITVCDRHGILLAGDPALNPAMADLAQTTNPRRLRGSLAEALAGADVFVGVSAPKMLTGALVKTMAARPIVFAMANPEPEIFPDEALAAGAAVVATGRSDFPNQINNVLAFPGIFRGALDVRARTVNAEMKLAAALALAELVDESDRAAGRIIPGAFDPRVALAVALATAKAAQATGVAQAPLPVAELEAVLRSHLP